MTEPLSTHPDDKPVWTRRLPLKEVAPIVSHGRGKVDSISLINVEPKP